MTEDRVESPYEIDHGCFRRHMRLGWWSLLFFLALGIVLESLHGFKIGGYLDVGNEVRRLMWRLAHAHGALLGLVHIAFAVTALTVPVARPERRRQASICLVGAGVLLPAGFFLGGVVFYPGDPGLGILLVPVGAVLLFGAVFVTAAGVGARLGCVERVVVHWVPASDDAGTAAGGRESP